LGAGRRHPLFTIRKPWPQNGIRPSLRHQPEGLRTPLKGAAERSIIKGFMNGRRDIEGGASPRWGLAPPKKQGYPGKEFESYHL
jgi:hypothetical protein